MVIPLEQPLSPQAYAFLATLVHERSRIQLGPDRQALLAGRLGQRLRTLGLAGYEDYCRLLESPQGEEEVGSLIDLVSTNHTHFFREPEHFTILADQVLPRLADRRGPSGRPLQIWSAASSSGEEPYTLAIVLAEFARQRPHVTWQVSASDISRRMLERCRLGIYEAEKVAVPDEQLRRYFLRGFAEREGFYRVRPELRRHVHVHHINLFQPDYPLPAGLDVIFCRNVMIYFDQPSRQELLERLVAMLAPGGTLFVGHAESLLGLRHGLRTEWPSVYVRPE
ncbi:MAG: CheR family methyltransferase [Pirellulales bacterium]|jgi:chemotaxis protein methyltransferase CheR